MTPVEKLCKITGLLGDVAKATLAITGPAGFTNARELDVALAELAGAVTDWLEDEVELTERLSPSAEVDRDPDT